MNGSKSDKQFLKSLGVFFVTLLICIAVFAGVGLSVIITENYTKPEKEQETAKTAAESNNAETVVIMNIGEKVYFCRVRFDFSQSKYSCAAIENRTVFSLGKSRTLSEHYKNSGTAGLVLALKDYFNRDFRYVNFSENGLSETVDAFGGVTVGGHSSRLMGSQATKYIKNEKSAAAVVEGLLSAYFENCNGRGIRNNYLTLIDKTDTDLSYMDFYNHWNEIKNMEEG